MLQKFVYLYCIVLAYMIDKTVSLLEKLNIAPVTR